MLVLCRSAMSKPLPSPSASPFLSLTSLAQPIDVYGGPHLIEFWLQTLEISFIFSQLITLFHRSRNFSYTILAIVIFVTSIALYVVNFSCVYLQC